MDILEPAEDRGVLAGQWGPAVRIVRVIAASRTAHQWLVALALVTLLSFLLGTRAVVIHLSAALTPNKLPFPELCSVVAAVAGVILLRPRTWEWDRVATGRASAVSAVCAFAGIAAPAIVVVAGSMRLPDGVPWGWQVANCVIFGAVAFCLGPLVGSGLAGGLTLLLYMLCGVANHLVPGLRPLFPVVAYPGPEGNWIFAVALAVLALGINARTRGSTARARRLFAET
ncbi:hypothetical protein ACIQMJ_26805 [Actinosynnema sp. NPDC091369]